MGSPPSPSGHNTWAQTPGMHGGGHGAVLGEAERGGDIRGHPQQERLEAGQDPGYGCWRPGSKIGTKESQPRLLGPPGSPRESEPCLRPGTLLHTEPALTPAPAGDWGLSRMVQICPSPVGILRCGAGAGLDHLETSTVQPKVGCHLGEPINAVWPSLHPALGGGTVLPWGPLGTKAQRGSGPRRIHSYTVRKEQGWDQRVLPRAACDSAHGTAATPRAAGRLPLRGRSGRESIGISHIMGPRPGPASWELSILQDRLSLWDGGPSLGKWSHRPQPQAGVSPGGSRQG